MTATSHNLLTNTYPPSTRFASKVVPLFKSTLIIIGVCLAYLPAMQGGPLMDDDQLLTENALVKAPDGLYRIWFTTESIDYWPITNTSFWLEWRLWGKSPVGYHATNVALHILAALLLWEILQKLRLPGAYLAALLFALHPLNVQSVAWISERKNTLAMVFFLLSIWFYLRDRDLDYSHLPPTSSIDGPLKATSRRCYWLSLLAFTLAVLSKGSVAILPFVLLGFEWWSKGLDRTQLLRIVPYFAIAISFACLNVWFQTHGATTAIRNASPIERLCGAGAVVWFYLAKAILPLDELFIYRDWQIVIKQVCWWIPFFAAASVTFLLWKTRGTGAWARGMFAAWCYFCIALLPVLGFVDTGFMQYTLVADHYAYIALIGVTAMVAAGLTAWYEKSSGALRFAAVIVAVTTVPILAIGTGREAWLYGHPIELYTKTLAENPQAWPLRVHLGRIFKQTGRLPEAIAQYELAMAAKSDRPEIYTDLGNALELTGKFQNAIEQYQKALALNASDPIAHNGLGVILAKQDRLNEAIDHYRQAVQAKPDFADAFYNLGMALLRAGQPHDALKSFHRVLELDPQDTAAAINSALAYAQLGQSVEAIAAANHALALANAQGQLSEAKQIDAWLKAYRESNASPK